MKGTRNTPNQKKQIKLPVNTFFKLKQVKNELETTDKQVYTYSDVILKLIETHNQTMINTKL